VENVMGCDISKEWIDLYSEERAWRTDNSAAAAREVARSLPVGSLVGMEATGEYHVKFADTLVRAGHTVFVINPRWIRNYAKGVGLRGKSDRTDAALIARYVKAEHSRLHHYMPPSAEHRELRKLLLQRRKLVQLKTATRQSLGKTATAIVGQFDKAIAQLELGILGLLRGSAQWSELYERLLGQPGVGPVLGAYLVEILTRIPFTNQDAFIAHTGLDPRASDSGQKRGRRRLTGHGDAALRSALFIAAMSACQSAPWQKAYQAQRQKGLAGTAALVVVARKIARTAFALFKTGSTFRYPMTPCVQP
jgi:transposase